MALLSGATRSGIQEATRASLVAAATAAGSRVTVGRQEPYSSSSEMPAIDIAIVRVSHAVAAPRSGACTPIFRSNFEIAIGCRASAEVDADADAAISSLVEQVLDATVGSLSYLDALSDTACGVVGVDVQHYVGIEDVMLSLAAATVTLRVEVDEVQYG